ncbi:MAG: radical SAM protein [bacterium]
MPRKLYIVFLPVINKDISKGGQVIRDYKMPHHLNIIFKPINDLCNLNCEYCHEKRDQELLSSKQLFKPILYTDLPITKWFPEFVYKFKNIPDIKKINFCWHGGEPLLLPYDFYRRITHIQRKQLEETIKYENVVITNCINMDKNKIKWLKKLNIYLSVSCDGPNYLHNQGRFQSIRIFKKFRKNLELVCKECNSFSLHIVINQYNLQEYGAIFDFLKLVRPKNGVALGICFMENNILSGELLKNFFRNLFDLWWPERTPYIMELEEIIKGLNFHPPRYCKLAENGCLHFITVDAQGLLYSGCQRKEDMKIGYIDDLYVEDIINRHLRNIASLNNKIVGKTFFEYLNCDPRFIYFQSKGCPNRLNSKNQDPYFPVYADLITHIAKKLKIDTNRLIEDLMKRNEKRIS